MACEGCERREVPVVGMQEQPLALGLLRYLRVFVVSSSRIGVYINPFECFQSQGEMNNVFGEK